jgi:2-amino-4-ketopentanoate thiolase alpha subunit
MSELPAGTRVELRRTLLGAAERAPGIPPDTAGAPYEMRVRGRLAAPARLGEAATIVTPTGRRIEGVLDVVAPADDHSFGRPHPVLAAAAEEIAALREELDG